MYLHCTTSSWKPSIRDVRMFFLYIQECVHITQRHGGPLHVSVEFCFYFFFDEQAYMVPCVHMRVFVCVCAHARCMRACVRACLRACVLACVRACMLACVRACVRACVHACMHACVRACFSLSVSFSLVISLPLIHNAFDVATHWNTLQYNRTGFWVKGASTFTIWRTTRCNTLLHTKHTGKTLQHTTT